jgi:hypothetical protein
MLRPWVHWHYTPAEWQRFCEAHVRTLAADALASSYRQHWKQLAAIGLVGAVYAWFCIPLSGLGRVFCAAGFCLAIVLFCELGIRHTRKAPERLAARLREATPDAYFGRDGLVCGSEFYSWLDRNWYLTSAAFEPGEVPSVVFCFEKITPAGGAPRITQVRRLVPIPANAAADLPILQARLAERCPRARVRLA